ncbi:MAG: radical SAM protein [Phycisphaerae bacterium]|jgi:MoaA/NifB/PqqE/SkfB family radical SAM enzyme
MPSHNLETTSDFVVSPSPKSLCIELTNECNMNCQHCLYAHGRNKYSIISNEIINRLKPVIKNADFIGLDGGGEVLLNRQTRDILKNIASFSQIDFTTNGKNLTQDVIDELPLESVAGIHISFDGFANEPWSILRKGNEPILVFEAFKRIMKAISARQLRTTVWCNIVLSTLNIKELYNSIVRIADLGITRFHCIHLIITHDELQKYSLFYCPSIYNNEIQAVKALAEERGLELYTPQLFGQPKLNTGNAWPYHYQCELPFDHAVIRSNGKVVVCCDPRTEIGDAAKEDFLSIWHSEAYNKFRSMVNSKHPPKECRECIHPTYINVDNLKYPKI